MPFLTFFFLRVLSIWRALAQALNGCMQVWRAEEVPRARKVGMFRGGSYSRHVRSRAVSVVRICRLGSPRAGRTAAGIELALLRDGESVCDGVEVSARKFGTLAAPPAQCKGAR